MEIKNRRTFLQIISGGIIAFFIFIWNKLTLNHIEISGEKEKMLPFNKNKTISFYGNYIIVNQENKTTVLSSHCTHLGCRIDKQENGRLVCPCHGSEYDLNGSVLKGPAYKNLRIVPSEITDEGKNILIKG
ncbi:QcrA and Rieske domain-containing protein [Maribellus maritimus]|uniref:QcrA and Rieske domain-containing protein n=1 Tax=Maribellus maritimus TaxID=2870838 RepID=UPI001EE9DA76|nr:Rieske (2Fe-2S) protein [Maribellus maritimus]MCG6186627.1 Rieske (2Fe-2S) protein [Maribellus maritimus]